LQSFFIRAAEAQIQIIPGTLAGLEMLAKTFFAPGDTVLAECPTQYSALSVLRSSGMQVVEVPFFPDGPDPGRLEALIKRHRPKALYLMPHFSVPSGTSLTPEQQRHILTLAERYNTCIIEDDYQSDFYYDNRRRIPLKTLDRENRVIYIKSFARILMPGLQVGFMVVPRPMRLPLGHMVAPGYNQRALDWYLRKNGLPAHTGFIRGEYARRYQTVLKAMENHFARCADFTPAGGGLGFWIKPRRLPVDMNMEALCQKFFTHNVVAAPGSLFSSYDMPFFRICFAAVPENRLEEGIRIMAAVMEANDG
jgi:DNA-binding transcriptional MocR family regulator